MERRQFVRKPLGGVRGFPVSLCLSSESLLHEGRTEEFELEANAVDISRGGLRLKLHILADLITLHPDHKVTVRLGGGEKVRSLTARVAHFDHEQGMIGLQFVKPLKSIEALA